MGSKNGQLYNRELIDMFTKLRILTGNSVLDKFIRIKGSSSSNFALTKFDSTISATSSASTTILTALTKDQFEKKQRIY
jgi:hypothetical protein